MSASQPAGLVHSASFRGGSNIQKSKFSALSQFLPEKNPLSRGENKKYLDRYKIGDIP
jgi:hypothetical protein